jgi:hypothetical protein
LILFAIGFLLLGVVLLLLAGRRRSPRRAVR